MPPRTAARPAPRDLVGSVRAAAPDATGVLLSSYKSWRIGRALARGLGLPLVVRQQNLEADYHHDLAVATPGLRGWALRADAARIARDDARLGRSDWVTATADISVADARRRAAAGTPNVAWVAPFAVDPSQAATWARRPVDPPRVLFLGALHVATNVAAVDWLLDSVWPLVRAARPDAALDVVGRSPGAALRSKVAATAGARLHADVPEVRPYVEEAAVAVNPAVTGSGVNVKLVECMAAGIPVVSTTFATEGLPLRPGVDLAVDDEPDGFAAAVVELLGDPRRAAELGAAGRARVLDLIDPVRNLVALAALMAGDRPVVDPLSQSPS